MALNSLLSPQTYLLCIRTLLFISRKKPLVHQVMRPRILETFFIIVFFILMPLHSFACLSQCQLDINNAFLSDYAQQYETAMQKFSSVLHTYLFNNIDLVALHGNPDIIQTTVLGSVDDALTNLTNNSISSFYDIINTAIISKYVGHCNWTTNEICGSPTSMSENIHDILNRTRNSLISHLHTEFAPGGTYETSLWRATAQAYQTSIVLPAQLTIQQENAVDLVTRMVYGGTVAGLYQNIASIVNNFNIGLDDGGFCWIPYECWDDWVPGLRAVMAKWP